MMVEKRDVSQAALIAVVILVGLNLRAFLTAVGPLAPVIAEATGLSLQGMSLFTLAPMILMGACAFAGPWLQSTFGARAAVLGALLILGVACGLRMVVSDGMALIGTAALCGLGVAIVQAVFPGVIKTYFPTRFAIMMGLYSSMLMAGGALGAQISPAVAAATGSWQLGLGWTVIPAAVAFIAGVIALPHGRAATMGGMGPGTLLRRPRTWLLMACFGLVNGGYSSCVAWLAAYYQSLGWTSTESGRLLAVMAVAQATAALGFPILASRRRDRRLWIWITLLLQITGFAGLALAPLAAPAFLAAAVGAGLGGCFALSMVVALDHLDHPAHAGALSALMQGGGFLIAAVPPWIVAVLHDISGSFTTGWLMHLGCIAVVLVLSFRLVPGGYAVAMGRDVAV
ncbi:MFS transporter [Rhizobium sp. Root268]|nr:MFS transporter [Rhizobium sp. Root1212]KRD35133.1 MFS transporter [Rhizobium sp. Root268]